MNDLIDAFIAYKRDNRGRARRTMEMYRHALALLVVYLGDVAITDASEDDLVAFSGPWLAKRGVLAASRHPYVSALRQFYLWLYNQRRIPKNPAAGLPSPRFSAKLPHVLELAHVEKIMWAPDFNTFQGARDGAMLALLAGCGMRVSGLVGMNVSDVVYEDVDGQPRMFVRVREKGDRQRLLPVPAEADLQLRLYMAHPDLAQIDRELPNGDKVLFVSIANRSVAPGDYRGERRRLNRRAVARMMRTYGRVLGIPEELLHPHALRHRFGTELAEDDVHAVVHQQLMGHRDPKSTQIYAHLAKRKLVAEIDRANPLAKINTPTTEILKRINKL